jgi:SAM-dependent methyltransferase
VTPYVCPQCRGALASSPEGLNCAACGVLYPVADGIADFARGAYYDNFSGQDGQELAAGHLEGLENEVGGTRSRIEGYYLPLLRRLARRLGPKKPGLPPGEVRVLDCGCGNGLSVDLLRDAGFAAWGNDLSALRKWQWRERKHRDHLLVADALKLPFPGGFFHAVLSSGVIEHIGVAETGGETYTVRPLPDRDEQRVRFLGELLRVLGTGGELWLDFPNGAFPIDFWHGTQAGGARVHPLDEGFLPTLREVRGYLAKIPGGWKARPLSPHGRLACRQVRRHWYGQLFYLPAAAFLWSTRLPGLRPLAGSPLNPYLVLAIGR